MRDNGMTELERLRARVALLEQVLEHHVQCRHCWCLEDDITASYVNEGKRRPKHKKPEANRGQPA